MTENLPGAAPPPDKQEKPKERSFGNKMFDGVFYPAIAFGVVFVASVYTVFATKFGKEGSGYKGFYEACVNTTETILKKCADPAKASSEKIRKDADYIATVLVSFSVGTVLTLPIKFFEDRRSKIADYFDKMHEKYFSAKPVDHASIKEEPKQSVGSILSGRLGALATVLAINGILGKYVNPIADKLSDAAEQHWKKRGADSETVEKVKGLAWAVAFEGAYTAVGASLVYAISRIAATSKIFDKKEVHAASVEPATVHGIAVPAPAKEEHFISEEGQAAWQQKFSGVKNTHVETVNTQHAQPKQFALG